MIGKGRTPEAGSRTLKYFILIFLVLLSVSTSISLIVLLRSKSALIEKYKTLSSNQIEIQARLLRNHFDSIQSDLHFLPHLNEIMRFKEAGGKEDLEFIENEFLEFIKSKKEYDQLRYINFDGQEIARVNFNNGNPEIVTLEKLQNKSERYYFTETIKLSEDAIYTSPFDLNIENGKIELPLKPMLRFGTPVSDQNNQITGIIVLNYLGENIINDLKEATKTYPGTFSLVNPDGYWLFNNNPDNEWGFMFSEKAERTLAAQIPEIWRNVSTQKKYQILSDNTLYTSALVSLFDDDDENKLIIVNSTSVEEMKAGKEDTIRTLRGIIPVSAALLGILSIILARTIEQRNRYRSELKRSALYDNLTGLPNRTLLTELAEQAIVQARRYSQRFALLFLDLDGFKNVNDSLGHDAGDILLKKVTAILTENIRSSDAAARFGGDEFVILLSRITNKKDCIVVAEKILTELSKEFKIKGNSAHIGGSIGIIAPQPNSELSFKTLLKKADDAMYEVKKSGKNNYCIVES